MPDFSLAFPDAHAPVAPVAPVARVLYASQATVRHSVYAEMERIRASALRHNEPLGVATVLLHQSGWFVQWKEGPAAALKALIARIAHDPRHHSLHVVHASRGPRLLHGPWSMSIVQSGEPPESMGVRVALLRRMLEKGWQEPLSAAWRRLSTPWQQHAIEPARYERVLVCSARGDAAFTLVAQLARAARQPVVHQRSAGFRGLDVGTDYVDFGDGERVLRVIAMARRGLSLPLTRALLPDYGHVLLLLSGDTELDAGLLQRVLEACEGLSSQPRLLGVHPDADVHAPVASLARGHGLAYEPVVSALDAQGCWDAVRPHLEAHRRVLRTILPPADPLALGALDQAEPPYSPSASSCTLPSSNRSSARS